MSDSRNLKPCVTRMHVQRLDVTAQHTANPLLGTMPATPTFSPRRPRQCCLSVSVMSRAAHQCWPCTAPASPCRRASLPWMSLLHQAVVALGCRSAPWLPWPQAVANEQAMAKSMPSSPTTCRCCMLHRGMLVLVAPQPPLPSGRWTAPLGPTPSRCPRTTTTPPQLHTASHLPALLAQLFSWRRLTHSFLSF